MQLTLPYRAAVTGFIPDMVRQWFGDGNKKTAVVNLNNIGGFVSRIISDPRTIKKYVFINEDELTMNEVYEIASSTAGEDFHKIKLVVRRNLSVD